MKHNPKSSMFFVTPPNRCPYLENKSEQKIFTYLDIHDSQNINDKLTKQGFRRSQNILYRPSCETCTGCISTRIDAPKFILSKSQKRILKRNQTLKRSIHKAWATDEQYNLFKRYLDNRHQTGEMAEMTESEFQSMIEETNVRTKVIEYRDEHNILQACCLSDMLDDGISMIYSFYNPDLQKQSMGIYIILDHIAFIQQLGLNYVYLGYWVPGSATMNYKANFNFLEIYFNNTWQPFDSKIKSQAFDALTQGTALNEQLSSIKL